MPLWVNTDWPKHVSPVGQTCLSQTCLGEDRLSPIWLGPWTTLRANFRVFCLLPPQFSIFLPSLGGLLMELWARFKAEFHTKCAFGLPRNILGNPSGLWGKIDPRETQTGGFRDVSLKGLTENLPSLAEQMALTWSGDGWACNSPVNKFSQLVPACSSIKPEFGDQNSKNVDNRNSFLDVLLLFSTFLGSVEAQMT